MISTNGEHFQVQSSPHWALACGAENANLVMDGARRSEIWDLRWTTQLSHCFPRLACSSVGMEVGSSAPRPFSAILSLTASLMLEVKNSSAGWTRSLMKNLVLAPRWVWPVRGTTDINFITAVWEEKITTLHYNYNDFCMFFIIRCG